MELDPQVVGRALQGDRSSFQQLTEQSWRIVYLFIHDRVRDVELVQDLTQDTFLTAFEKRSTLRNGGSFLAWLLTIASNKIIDDRRRRSARPTVHHPALEEEARARIEEEVASPPEAAERQRRIESALAQLDDLYRTVLILRYWSGLSPAQIARLLEEPEGTIRNRIFRAHARMREILESLPGADEERRSS